MTSNRSTDLALPPALDADSFFVEVPDAGSTHVYGAVPTAGDATPLLLIHSVNAAPSAYEMKPVFDAFSEARPTYAMELPGFGRSERRDLEYTPQLMTEAIRRVVDEIRDRHSDDPVDAMALSLSCEFLARAAVEDPGSFRTVALVSPTGLEGGKRRDGPAGENRGMPVFRSFFGCPLWWGGLFSGLTRPGVVRYFLRRTFGRKEIDKGLWDYAVQTSHQPGAEHAPLSFLSGFLFSRDSTRLYETLELPVWMSHGVRGDFTDYGGKSSVSDRPNWQIEVFETGALPHFEVPDEFLPSYRGFLERGGPDKAT